MESSKSSPGAELHKLPDELLIEILAQLDASSLKEARLACRRWSKAGARSLFRRIYFAPRKNLMSVFQAITRKSAFAVNITELVYDAGMFWSKFLEPSAYSQAYTPITSYLNNQALEHIRDTTGSIDDVQSMTWSTKCYESSARYAWLLQEQSCIIYAEKDFDTLCEGIARLPNLERISVVDRYDGYVDYVPYIWTDLEWGLYQEWSAKFHSDSQWTKNHHENVLPPSRWSEVASDDEDTKHPWDFRGMEHLLKAALLHAPKLKELLMGCDVSKLSADLFTSGDSARVLQELAPRLTILRADCTWLSPEPNFDFEISIENTLDVASRLEELHLTLRGSLADWDAIIEGITWPRLRVLALGDGALSFSALKTFSLTHTQTLRELRLRNIYLSEPEGWRDAAEELGKILKLDFIALASMADGMIEGEPYITREIAESAICRFMQWVPKGQLRMASEGDDMSLAWHVNNFRLSPRLAHFVGAEKQFSIAVR